MMNRRHSTLVTEDLLADIASLVNVTDPDSFSFQAGNGEELTIDSTLGAYLTNTERDRSRITNELLIKVRPKGHVPNPAHKCRDLLQFGGNFRKHNSKRSNPRYICVGTELSHIYWSKSQSDYYKNNYKNYILVGDLVEVSV